MTYQGAHRLRPGNRPLPTPAPGPGVSLWSYNYTRKLVGGFMAWNGLGVAIGLCAAHDAGTVFGALLSLLAVVAGGCFIVGGILWFENSHAEPPGEDGA